LIKAVESLFGSEFFLSAKSCLYGNRLSALDNFQFNTEFLN
jgi:hypothetical protein